MRGWTTAHAGAQSLKPASNTTAGDPDPMQVKLSRAPSRAGAINAGCM
jgi:hypothetical protein